MGSRQWCFTIHADEAKGEHAAWPLATADDHPLSAWESKKLFRFCFYSVERCPRTRRIHLQGFICLSDKMRLAGLKKEYHSTAHWETSRGTFEQNMEYCSKDKSHLCGPFQMGTPPAQGKRNDLETLHTMVKAKATNYEILEATQGKAARFEKAINFMRFVDMEKSSDRQMQGVRVIVLYGPTGSGKTYAAVNVISGGNYYKVETPAKSGDKLWFNGYEGQPYLIIDDFSGGVDFRHLLTLLDKYKLKVEIKGGHTWACWTNVIITSNQHPSHWYSPTIDSSPLQRRISEIRRCTAHGLYTLVDWDGEAQGDDQAHQAPEPPPAAIAPPSPTVIPSTPPSQMGHHGRTCSPTQIVISDDDNVDIFG